MRHLRIIFIQSDQLIDPTRPGARAASEERDSLKSYRPSKHCLDNHMASNGARSRTWCFTLNTTNQGEFELSSITEEVEEMWRVLRGEGATFLCIQLERAPSTGRLHYQGYLRFTNAVRLSTITRLIPRSHAERTRGSEQQNIKYVTKEESREAGPWRFGEESQQGRRTDLQLVRELVQEGASMKEICNNEEVKSYQALRGAEILLRYRPLREREKPLVYWFHGSTGSGKTAFVHEYCKEEKKDLWISNKNLEWLDGYDGEEVALIDDFRASHCSFSFLLRLLDRYPMRVPYKGGFTEWRPLQIYITCPYEPKYTYKRFTENEGDLNQLIRRIDEIRLFGDPVIPTYTAVSNNFRDV